MSQPILVGLGGKYQAGKDVIANFYRYQFGFKVVGFSDVLNDMLMVLNPIVLLGADGNPYNYREVVESRGYVRAKEVPEVRRLLQSLGTDVGRRMIHEDLWVDLTAERVQSFMDKGHNVAVTGVRYPNEVNMIRRLGGVGVYVVRPGHEDTGSHASELSVGPEHFDHVLVNDGDIAHLEDKSADLLQEIYL